MISLDKTLVKGNLAKNHSAIKSSRYGKSGETTRKTKLSSKNFDKLMQQRGLSKKDASSLKASFDRSSPMQVRHAKKGEQFTVTHGTQNASGIFVSKGSLGKTPDKRINKGALPNSNSAKFETKVALDKNQNLIYGKIAPQSKFQKMDPKQTPRKGGGTQVITDGGYKKGAIKNNDTKFPIPVKSSAPTASQKFRERIGKTNTSSNNKTSKSKSNSRGR